jgi:site-specific recombinase XerD
MKNKTCKTNGRKSVRFEKVRDGKGNPIRGLWKRGSRYYAQITLTRPDGSKKETKLALEATNLSEARLAHRKLLVQRSEGQAVFSGQAPLFEEYARLYLSQIKGQKADGTVVVERGHLRFWVSQFGQLRLNQITHARVREGLTVMAETGKAQRTKNLSITVLRNVLNMALTDGLVSRLPITKDMTPKPRRRQRPLYTPVMLEQLCEAALRVSANGVRFCEFVRLLAYSGGRMSETLRLRWLDVNWARETLCFGGDGLAKSKEPRLVNFSPQLKSHLEQMYANRESEEWLFVSAQRGREGKVARHRTWCPPSLGPSQATQNPGPDFSLGSFFIQLG